METLLIVTYDEHGGFYDHVPMPVRNVPNPDGIIGPPPSFFKFGRLGVRVPTIMVSPWIKKGTGMIMTDAIEILGKFYRNCYDLFIHMYIMYIGTFDYCSDALSQWADPHFRVRAFLHPGYC